MPAVNPNSVKLMRKRKEFTDAQKAAIYTRDRATCCFSGANLWLLDAPLRPGYERDWVDHVKPAARGGNTDEQNGVCASHTFNAKKRHNAADNVYLFEEGLPTLRYFSLFGSLPPQQKERLQRLARLVDADWYFNRAIGLVLLGFDQRCNRERYKETPKRDDRYWFRAAYRKLTTFQSIADEPTLEERRIVGPLNETQQIWLCLRPVCSEQQFVRQLEPLFVNYRANYLPWAKYFFDAESASARQTALRYAESCTNLSHDTLQCIRADYQLRNHND